MTDSLSATKAFEALSDQYRRQLLLALAEAGSQDETGLEPAELIDTGGASAEPAAEYIEAVHVHLPKLDSIAVIDWNRENDQVSKGESWDEIVPLLQLLQDHQDELPDGWES